MPPARPVSPEMLRSPAAERTDAAMDVVTIRASRYDRLVKPAIDAVGAMLLLLVSLPVLLAAVVVAWASTGASPIFVQPRVGRHGRVFNVYKLRTMRDDPEAERRRLQPDGTGRIVHKVADDPRITRAGRWLRKWSIDELPQLWNVLQGEMSLVGPRPELVPIVERYEAWQHRRHAVKPGITGLWQVSSRSHGLMHEHVELDLEYLECQSLATDLRILLSTIPAALGRRPGI